MSLLSARFPAKLSAGSSKMAIKSVSPKGWIKVGVLDRHGSEVVLLEGQQNLFPLAQSKIALSATRSTTRDRCGSHDHRTVELKIFE